MKKILSLIGIIAMSGTTVVPVIACKAKASDTPKEPSSLVVNDQVKQWAQETSVIAKSLLTSKQQNINTNNLLNDTLKTSSNNNIKHDVNNITDGNSYQDFISDWGYNKTITSNFAEHDFINNSAPTAFDNLQKIKDTIAQIKNYLPMIDLITPENIVSFLKDNKEQIKPILIQLFKNSSMDIPALLSNVGGLLDSLKGFNPKKDLTIGDTNYWKYDADIAKSIELTVLGANGNDGWFANSGYQQQSEAATSNISTNLFTKENIKKITSWDSFFIAKTSIEINGLYKTASNNFLGADLNDALIYNDDQQLVGIDTSKLIEVVLTLISGDPIKLISLLIPVIKWQVLGFAPTTNITTIIDGSTPSNSDKGILNIKDVITNVKNLIASPENFANFFINLLSANEKNQGLFSDVVINTSKGKNATTFTQAMASSQLFCEDISNKLKEAFSKILPYLTKYSINDWLEAIIKTFTNDSNLNIDFSDLTSRLTNLANSKELINAINLVKDSDTIDDTKWSKLLELLGVKDGTFVDTTPLGMILGLLKKYEPTIDTILTNINTTIDNYIDKIQKEAEKIIDFNNTTKSWTTIVDHWTYDPQTKQSTIFYTLQKENNIYNITVVIDGYANQEIGTKQNQIWIKDIIKKY